MKQQLFFIVSVFYISIGSAMANGNANTENGIININADCKTLNECVCQELCYDVCRIVNGESVCDESCKTICE